MKTHNDVKLGINVYDFVVFIYDGECRDPPFLEQLQCLDKRSCWTSLKNENMKRK